VLRAVIIGIEIVEPETEKGKHARRHIEENTVGIGGPGNAGKPLDRFGRPHRIGIGLFRRVFRNDRAERQR